MSIRLRTTLGWLLCLLLFSPACVWANDVSFSSANSNAIALDSQPGMVVAQVVNEYGPVIASVDYDTYGFGGIRGETLCVNISGTPGAAASFDVVGWRYGFPMMEIGPGRYRGRMNITPGMPVQQGSLVVHLVKDGLEAINRFDGVLTFGGGVLTAWSQPLIVQEVVLSPVPGTVTVVRGPLIEQEDSSTVYVRRSGTLAVAPVGPLFVNVAYPRMSDQIAGDFHVIGNATPFSIVTVEATVHRGMYVNGPAVSFWARANEYGNFKVPVHMPRHETVSLRVTAKDNLGNSSAPVLFDIATGP